MTRKLRALTFLLILATLLALIVVGVPLLRTYLADGFAPQRARSESPSAFSSTQLTDPVIARLSQSFTYLGKGSQCFVFLGEDRQTVLKLIRHHRYRFPRWTDHLHFPPFLEEIHQAHLEEKHSRRNRLETSLELAAQMPQACGLLYLHRGGDPLPQKITLKDRLRFTHQLKLTDYDFIVQERAEPLCADDTQALRSLLRQRMQLGIGDTDPVVTKNAGRLGERAIFIDVGSFTLDPRLKDPAFAEGELIQLVEGFLQKVGSRSDPASIATLPVFGGTET